VLKAAVSTSGSALKDLFFESLATVKPSVRHTSDRGLLEHVHWFVQARTILLTIFEVFLGLTCAAAAAADLTVARHTAIIS
jgi:hypothetical protein